MNALILQFKRVTLVCLIILAPGCFALLPSAQALLPPPPPGGGYPGANMALGENALLGLTSGLFNTANQ